MTSDPTLSKHFRLGEADRRCQPQTGRQAARPPPPPLHPVCCSDLEKNAELFHVCALGYRLLQQMVCRNPVFAMRLLESVPFMISQLAHCWHAADTLSEMFHNNSKLLRQMPDRLVTCFVRMCIDKRCHGGYIKFLRELCVCEGQVALSSCCTALSHAHGTAPAQGCIRREETLQAAPEAVRPAVGGGCQSG